MSKRSPVATCLHVIDRTIWHIEEKAVAFGVIGLAVILIGNITFRFFNSSLASTEELSQFLMFYITFLGTSYAARTGLHIRMSMLSDAFKGVARKILSIVIAAVCAAVMFYLTWLSYKYVMKIASLHRVSPILQIPVQYVWMVMPIGMFLTGIQYTLALGRNIISPGSWISYSVSLDSAPDAFTEQTKRATLEAAPEGKAQGTTQDTAESSAQGLAEGAPEGSSTATPSTGPASGPMDGGDGKGE
ncbi:MAG: TRAP transporter small permease [Deltaproteobacteria bacterium]|jgi:TRAP-type C4-dicarboxylate transport system permease small subunit|nr:TRAP transporter small permease [Deltaproteobacteria bacterium]